jgi:pimeloyl-ACP methyl ester carboxylesterase
MCSVRTATFCVLLAVAPAEGSIAANSGRDVTPDAYAAPDNRVQVGGSRVLNLRCSGAGDPVVVLEAGGNADSSVWFRVQPRVAESTRVCAYDRAGYGFSDEGPMPRDLDALVADLRALIDAAAIAKPVVLVGHSLGSNIVRRYAQKHPSDIAGLVLVDPPEQGSDARMPEEWQEQIKAQLAHRAGVLDLCEKAATQGDADTIAKTCLRSAPAWMSAAVAAAMISNKSEPRYWRTLRAELASNNNVFASPVPADESYGALPLMLLRAIDQAEDAPPEILRIAAEARIQTHSRLIAASTRSELIDVADASHDIHLDQPDQVAAAVARLIASLSVADVRSARDEAR